MNNKHYSFGKFVNQFGVWKSYIGYTELKEEKLLVFDSNNITKHTHKYTKWCCLKKMNELFYVEEIKRETRLTKLLKFFKGYFCA